MKLVQDPLIIIPSTQEDVVSQPQTLPTAAHVVFLMSVCGVPMSVSVIKGAGRWKF